MKTLFPAFGSALLVGGLLLGAVARGAEPDAPAPANEPAAATPAPAAPEPEATPAAQPAEAVEAPHPAAEAQPAEAGAPAAETPATPDAARPTEARQAGATNATAATSASPGGNGTTRPAATPAAGGTADTASAVSPTPSTPVVPVKPGEKGLRLNFRNAPLEQILNYLSEAAGFIIVLEAKVEGRVDVWSAQPLDQDEAVVLLNTVLNKNGFAAIRNERTLTIINRDDAKKRNTPVVQGSNPDLIPKNDDIVTQIIPLRFINAVQVSKDLATLIPSSANVAANEGGNALLVTDTQANIHRLAQIIKALDTSISSSFSIKVFSLQYADAKSLATVIKDVFQTQETSTRNAGNAAQQFFNRFRGAGGGGPGGVFGGGPGGGGGAGGGADASGSGGRPGASRVVAVSDDRSNSVVVSAPDDVMPSVEGLVTSIDVPVEDVTELRVFRLKFADPLEMADLLSGLFQSSTSSQNSNNRGGFRFGGGPFGGGGFGNNAAGSGASGDRMLKQTQVTAVADQRTRSVVVSASRAMMEQIVPMVAQLDSDPARKRRVFVYDVENTDPQAVQDIVETLFPEQNNRNTRTSRSSTQQNSNQLNNRQTQNRNQSRSSSTGFGTSSFGSGFGSTGR